MVRQRPNVPGPGVAGFNAGGRRASAGAADRGNYDDQGAAEEEVHGRALILASVARDARLDSKFFLLITLSAAIATLGLLQNSAAVVIGAMLVSPLLGPIMGMGFGLATIDSTLIKRSLITLGAGMLVAVMVAMLIVWLSPIQDVTTEIRGRTQPNLLDLGVAVVGGIAGVYAILRKLSGVMVGVAIATALVPPLSTVGFGIATGRFDFALGAALLFLTNTLAIGLSATVVARISKFGPDLTPQHTMMQVVGIVTTLGVLSIPLAISLNNLTREFRARGVVQSVLDDTLSRGDRVDTLNVRIDDGRIVVDGVVLIDSYHGTLNTELARRIGARLDRPADVQIVQLRQQSNAVEQVENGFNRRLTALEQRSEESAALLSALTVGGLIERERVLVDPHARSIIVARNREQEGEAVASAIDRVVASVQINYPAWLIRQAAWLTPPAANAKDAAPETPR